MTEDEFREAQENAKAGQNLIDHFERKDKMKLKLRYIGAGLGLVIRFIWEVLIAITIYKVLFK